MVRNGDAIPLLRRDVTDEEGNETEDEDLFVNFNEHDDLKSRKRKPQRISCCCKCLLAWLLIFGFVCIGFFVVLIHRNIDLVTAILSLASTGFTMSDVHFPNVSEPDWITEIPYRGSEAALRTVHVNDDGVLDIISGFNMDGEHANLVSPECVPYLPGGCTGTIMAFDGKDGSVLYTIFAKAEIFSLKCPEVDVNHDGIADCFASGRFGTFLAFNPRNGTVIWSMPSMINQNWNVFGPAFISDLNGDGVQDMVVVNGGDATYSAEEQDRKGNELLILSGSDGELIGQKKFPIPDNKESYCFPVIYELLDMSQYILFGSGGETIPGALYAISLRDMLSYVSPGTEFNLTGSYNHWDWMAKGIYGTLSLYQHVALDPKNLHPQMEFSRDGNTDVYVETRKKGVMLPPSLVDMNLDGKEDIIFVTHDGILAVLSGSDLSHVWGPLNFTMDVSTESYTMPAFGYFDDDKYPDIMVTWQTGTYPKYDTQLSFVISGFDGNILWYKQTPANTYTNMALLAISSTLPHRDMFFFTMSSTNQRFSSNSNSPVEDNSDGDYSMPKAKRHMGAHIAGGDSGSSCDHVESYTMDYFLMDRTTMNSPLLVFRNKADKYFYNITAAMSQEVEDEDHDQLIEGNSTVVDGFIESIKSNNGSDSTVVDSFSESIKSDNSSDSSTPDNSTSDGIEKRHSEAISNKRVEMCAVKTPIASSSGIVIDLDGDGLLELLFVETLFARKTWDDIHLKAHMDIVLHSTIRKYNLKQILTNPVLITLDEVLVNTSMGDNVTISELQLADSSKQRWSQRLGRYQNGVY